MNNRPLIVTLLAAFLLQFTQPLQRAEAFRIPVGTMQAEKRLEPESEKMDVNQGLYDPTESLTLVSMVKLLAHYLPQQIYFLNSEPTVNYPGINIISMLIKLAAPARMLERAGNKPAKPRTPPDSLNLAPPVINAPNPTNATAKKPVKKPGKQVRIGPAHPSLDDADTKTTAKSGDTSDEKEDVSISTGGIQTDVKEEPRADKIASTNLLSDFLAPTIPNKNTAQQNMQFLFWTMTVEPTTTSARESNSNASFDGSFVACQRGTKFKSVRNRKFTLEEGKLVASNQGGDLGFETPLGSIEVPPGTACLIVVKKDSLSVLAIEAEGKAHITVKGNHETINLSAGQQLILNPDKTISKVSLAQILAKEALLNASPALTEQQAAAVNGLLKRISVSTTTSSAGPE